MAENYELPNVDIFDPVMTAKYWAKCATQQEINVYLNKQIDINRKLLIDTIKAQNDINSASKTKLADHDSRIAALESEVKALDTAQTNLNSAFQSLQTDNNNFKSNVDLLLNQYQTTINLLQQNVDAIKLSNENAWNEINNLKSQFDPDLLNSAIAGYQSVLNETKSYTDSEAAKLKSQIDGVATDLQNTNTTLQQMIKDSELQQQTNLQSFMNGINADLESQNQRITSFIQNTDNVLQLQRTWLTNEIARVDARIDSLTSVVADNKTSAAKDLENAKTNIQQQLDSQREAYTANNTEMAALVDAIKTDLQSKIDSNLTQINNNHDATITRLSGIESSDMRQWDTINSILTAQNKINEDMETLHEYIVEQVGLVTARIEPIESSVTELQKGQNAVALRAEYLEQRTGWKYKVTAQAGTAETLKYNVGFGVLTLVTSANQVTASIALNSGCSGLVSVKDTAYGMFQVISNTAYNIISNAAQPNLVLGHVMGYAGSASPVDFIVWYDPTTKLVTFQCGYETNEQVMPKVGGDAQKVTS